MRQSIRYIPICLLSALVASCGSDVASTADLAARMAEAMGGADALASVETLVMQGDGTRTRLGQIPETGGEDPIATLTGVTETIDLANGRAAFDNDITNGGFMQHRTEVLTSVDGQPVAWGNTRGRPNMAATVNGIFSWATQNSPEWLLRRNVVTIARAALATASDAETAAEVVFNGETALHGTAMLGDEQIDLYFDPESGLLTGFDALDTETMLGDVEAEYIFSDYAAVDGLMLPHAVEIRKEGRLYSSITYASIAINDSAALGIFEIPEDVQDQVEAALAAPQGWSPITWNELAPNLYHAVAFSHHSMVVEFPDFVVVVEGPYTEAQSLTVGRMIEGQVGKPIAFVVPTHPHYDHTGGIRGLAAQGADVLVAAGHEAELGGIVESPHTNPPDALARNRAAGNDTGVVEVFENQTTHVVTGGDQRLELYAVDTLAHVNPMVLAYVPSAGALFQSDLGVTAGADAQALVAFAEEHDLDIDVVVGGHGGTTPWSAVVAGAEAEAE